MRVYFDAILENVNVENTVFSDDISVDFVSLNDGSIQLSSEGDFDTNLEGNELSGVLKPPISVYIVDENGDGHQYMEDELEQGELAKLIENAELSSLVVYASPSGEEILKDAKIKKASANILVDGRELILESDKAWLDINW